MKKSAKKAHFDPNKIAFAVTQKATQEVKYSKSHLSEVMSHMGRMGGLKGGKARANALSPERRKEIAKKAAEKRWLKNK